MKKRHVLAVGLAAVALAAGGAAGWLLGTTSGARFALARASAATDGKLTATVAGGSLSGLLELRDVAWRDPAAGVDVRIARATVDADVLPLLSSNVIVRSLVAEGVDVALTTVPVTDDAPFDPRLPVDLVVEDATLTQLRVTRDGAPEFEAHRVATALAWDDLRLVLPRFAVDAPQGRVEASVDARLVDGYPGHAALAFRWREAERDHAGTLRVDSDGRAARAQLALTLPTPATLDATFALAAPHAWTGTLAVPPFDATRLDPASTLGTVSATLRGRGDKDLATLDGELAAGPYTAKLAPLEYRKADERVTLGALTVTSSDFAGSVGANGTIALAGDTPRAELVVEWQDVVLPEAFAGRELASAGRLDVTGWADAYAASGALTLGPPGRPTSITLKVDGTPQELAFETLELVQARGRLAAHGTVSLADAPAWRLEATADDFDPGELVADWPGSLDFALETDGTLEDAGPRAHVDLASLDGTLRGRRVSGAGDVRYAHDTGLSGALDLRSGESTLKLRGAAGDATDATVDFDVAQLGDWVDGGAGALRGTLRLRGAWPALAVRGHADGTALAYRGHSAGTLAADVDLAALGGAPDETPQGAATLVAGEVVIGELRYARVAVELDGNAAQHHVELDADGDVGIALALDGVRDETGWRGTLARLALAPRDLPQYALAAPARIAVTDAGVSVDESCLAGGGARLCVAANAQESGATLRYTLEGLPLALVKSIGAPDAPLRVDGTLAGRGDLVRDATGGWRGAASLVAPHGTVAYPDDAEAPLVEYRDLRVELRLAPDAQRVALHAKLDTDGRLDVDVTAREPDGALSGSAELELANLRFVELLTTELANVRGRALARYAIGGTLAAPRLDGRLEATGLAAEVPAAGLALANGTLTLAADDAQRWRLDGGIESGGGTLTLAGSGGIDADAPFELAVKGDRVLAADVPGAVVRISPDLTLSRKDGRLLVRGAARIPQADLDLERLPGGSSAARSRDVVVVDAAPATDDGSMPLDVDVAVTLGADDRAALDDDVDVKGYGLNGTVAGRLRIRERPGRPTAGTGEIRVTGKYRAYGQNLTIERGRLLFANTPLDDPGLDIRAVRKLRDVTPGVHVTGTAQRPQLVVFSTPAMERSEALSYLLTGRPLRGLKGGEGDMVTAAARALGTATGDLLAKSVGARLGVDEIGVEESETLGGAAFTVGKYLSPRLYIGYGVGVFDPGRIVTLRYALTRVFSVEVETGTFGSRAGIDYRIER